MIAALLLVSAPVATALDAEIAFARDAQRTGQWTAFRKWADQDAVMFTPHAVWAKSFLKSLKDPPRSISWRPTQTYSSCDGRTAVNMGPWFNQDRRFSGFFTTVWQRSSAGWRWVYDGGVPGASSSSKTVPRSVRASCSPPAANLPITVRSGVNRGPRVQDSGSGQSADKTLAWDWKVERDGARTFRVYLWNGSRYAEVIHAIDPARKSR